MKSNLPSLIGAVSALLLLGSCGGGKNASTADITPEAQAFYKNTKNEKGDPFFVVKTAADLPADLKWEDGAAEEEFGSSKAKKGGTYHVHVLDYPRTLRYIGTDANDAFRSYIQDYIILTLLGRHYNTLNYIPGLASQWARGADKKTFYFRLDPDARFSDGEKITAENYFFAFFFLRCPYNNAPWEHDFYSTKFENITKYDDHTISVTMATAKPDAIDMARSLYPIPIAFHKQMGKNYLQDYNWKFIPTTGAYEIKPEGLKKGQSVTMTRIKDWWAKDKKFYRQLFNPDRVVIEVVRDPDKAFEVFRTSELDVISLNVPERWHTKIPDNDPIVEKGYAHKVTFFNQVPRPTFGFWINSSKPLLKEQNIREGLQYASNWELVIKQVFYGDYERLNLVENGYGSFTNPAIKARPFDAAKAAEYFAKAGFNKRGADGILINDKGEKLAFTVTNGYKVMEPALTVIQQEARKAGVDLSIETPEPTAAFKKMNEKKHDLAFTAYNTEVEMLPRLWDEWHSDNAYEKDGKIKTDTTNLCELSDKEVDAWIDRYRLSTDVPEMKELAWKVEQKVYDDAVFIPAFKMPWYRLAHWRWVKWPDTFDVRTARDFEESWVFWIDEDVQKETQEAMKSGKTFPKAIESYEKWHEK